MIDPLGIFANSDLVKLDDTDKRALAASQRLVEILQKQTSVDTSALRSLQQQEIRVDSLAPPSPPPPPPPSPLTTAICCLPMRERRRRRRSLFREGAQLQEVATIVARKLWQNRRTLALTSNRLAVVALLQTLDRLEKGAAQRG